LTTTTTALPGHSRRDNNNNGLPRITHIVDNNGCHVTHVDDD